MNNDNNLVNSRQNNNFFSGFLVGLLVGAAIVFLLTTKKGKKILKAISEERFNDIADIFKDKGEALKSSFEPSFDKKIIAEKPQEKEDLMREEFTHRAKSIQDRPKYRRFFRGIPRRLN